MMKYQTVFKRYELKYLITTEQKNTILQAISSYVHPDQYGKTTIRNLYFDTDNYRLIRRSIDKPEYKEKLRIRSYGKADPDSVVFVEVKKKYKSVVYKRRIPFSESKAIDWICNKDQVVVNGQIAREIDYFIDFYGRMRPTVLLSYDREAFYANDDSNFRITFDENILCRQTELSLSSEIYGVPILEPEKVMMEIKCSGGIPLWMTGILSKERIYKTSFSKYGTAYRKLVFPGINKKAAETEEDKNA
ncbi:MAG: polyphosphate polymerase domain-containing protein [Clostridia bacterium]|nr:polyphosphate polymerase domain-containing protein [Clostridia bacterium]